MRTDPRTICCPAIVIVGNRGLPADLRLVDHPVQVKSGDEAGIDVEILRLELIAFADVHARLRVARQQSRRLQRARDRAQRCRRRRRSGCTASAGARAGRPAHRHAPGRCRSTSCTTARRLSVASLPRRLKPSTIRQHTEDQNQQRDGEPRPFAAVDPVEEQVVERTDQRDVERQESRTAAEYPAADRSRAEFRPRAPPIPNRQSRIAQPGCGPVLVTSANHRSGSPAQPRSGALFGSAAR